MSKSAVIKSPVIHPVKAALVLLLAGLLVACSSKELKPMELQDFEEQGRIRVQWSAGIGSGQDVRYTRLVPAIQGDTIFATDIKGRVYALDKTTGKRQWRVKLKEPVSAGVSVANGRLFIGTYNAEVIALDAEDGSEVWRAPVSSEVLSNPNGNGRVVAVQTFDGKLTGLDFDTGDRMWMYETQPPLLTLRGNAAPLVYANSVYAGFSSGKMVALQDSDGLLEWEQRIAIPSGRSEFEKLVDIDGTPIMVGDVLYVAAYQGQLMALSRATGRPLWVKPVSTHVDLSAYAGRLFVTESDSSVKAYRAGSGDILWTNEQLLRRKLTAPHAFGNYVAVSEDEGGYLHILDAADGSLVARKKIDGDGVRSPMISDGDTLYILSNDGKLVALKVEPNG